MMNIKIGISILFGLVLTGCASEWRVPSTSEWSQHRCSSADWGNIGYQDGGKGRDTQTFDRYVARCSTYQVNIEYQRAIWERYRRQGIEDLYCHTDNVKKLADNNQPLLNICPNHLKDKVEKTYSQQKDLKIAKELINRKEKDFVDIEKRLKKLDMETPTDPSARRYADELKRELRIQYRNQAQNIYEMKKQYGICEESLSEERICQKYDRISRGYDNWYY